MIIYRNPLEQWFWEEGWRYVGSVVLVLAVAFIVWQTWVSYKSKAERKKRWLAMTDGQRRQWRYFNSRNNFEHEQWEKQ